MQKINPQARRHFSLAVKREKRLMHGVGVLAGDAADGFVRVKCTAVTMGGDAETRVVPKGIETGPFPCFGCQQLFAKRLKCESECGSGTRPVSGHHAPARFEPRPSQAVRSRATLRRLHVHRSVHGIEFGQSWQTTLRELHGGDWSDCRDELATRYVGA